MTNLSLISHVKIEEFKSIKKCDLELVSLNILIGANGSGKSNFIEFLHLMSIILFGDLQSYTAKKGGANDLLHFGSEITQILIGEIKLKDKGLNICFDFALQPTENDSFVVTKAQISSYTKKTPELISLIDGSNIDISKRTHYLHIIKRLLNIRQYHFHDTSASALVKIAQDIDANEYLDDDANNIAPFLYMLKHHYKESYDSIVETIQRVAPFFYDFYLEPTSTNNKKIILKWKEKGSDNLFGIHMFSDGALRFIFLATVLLQPEKFKPTTIIIDEPELGLHPFAIWVLGGLIRKASKSNQIIIATQSPKLLDEFDIDNIIVVDRENDSLLSKPSKRELKKWIQSYSISELWDKNILGGRP